MRDEPLNGETLRTVTEARVVIESWLEQYNEIQPHRIARCTVHRLMRAEGLREISRAKGPRTTIPGARA
jgi:hypothetical protein